jgi:recombination protein RecT
MSNIQRFDNLKQVVFQIQPQFDELAKIHNAVNYKKESSFALQILGDSEYLANIAMGNPDSLKKAIINVAAVGLSLSPVTKLAYLVPRKKSICLDISYRGYIQLATESGAIKWAAAEVVREKDEYIFQGVNREPIHRFNPFSDRGNLVGCYCLAKTHDGEFILTQMSGDEVLSIRDRSESWKAYVKDAGKLCPWVTDETEMVKKTVIRRAHKNWPMGDTRARLDQAIDVSNEVDPIDLNPIQIQAPKDAREESLDYIRTLLVKIERSEDKYITHLTRVNKREIKKLEDLTDIEVSQAIAMLNQLLDAKLAREAKEKNEKFD